MMILAFEVIIGTLLEHTLHYFSYFHPADTHKLHTVWLLVVYTEI